MGYNYKFVMLWGPIGFSRSVQNLYFLNIGNVFLLYPKKYSCKDLRAKIRGTGKLRLSASYMNALNLEYKDRRIAAIF